MGRWVCKQHGDNCQSYVVGIVKELNEEGRQPIDYEKQLVEYLEES